MFQTGPDCRLCGLAIVSDPVWDTNQRTGERAAFHGRCMALILVERRERPAREQARRADALRDIAWRFERCSEGPEGFAAQLPVWPHARFDNQTFLEQASPKIIAALRAWKPGDGSLVLSAKTGAGKTAGAVALVHRLRADAERAFDPKALPFFLFVTAAQLAGARRQVKLGTGESHLIERAMSTGLLLLDELGFEQLDGVAFEVVNARYNKQAATIVTTGLQPAEFAQRYGSAVWRRLTESGTLVEDHGRKLAAVR